MKIKRFENVWIMGLILSGVILLSLYILKLIFPSFVVETAQNEQICKIGRYIDTHKWAWYLASSILSFTVYYLSCCACCRNRSTVNATERRDDNWCNRFDHGYYRDDRSQKPFVQYDYKGNERLYERRNNAYNRTACNHYEQRRI